MMATETYVCLDFGNTDLKVAFFEKGQLLETKRFQHLDESIGSIPANLPVVVSSVREKSIEERLIKNFKNLVVIHSNLKKNQ